MLIDIKEVAKGMYSITSLSQSTKKCLFSVGFCVISSNIFSFWIAAGLASKKVAEESMEKAAREVKEKVGISNEEGITDCGVSVDGTWQRRGHSSHHGVVTAISIETECEPGDLDLRPELCTNTSVCLTKSSLCCHYCSLHYNSSTTSTTQLTPPNDTECVVGEPDLSPQLCTSPSICQTQPLMCCKYCSSRDNSASRLSLYTIWIDLYYSISLFFELRSIIICLLGR
ncbi:uncharacterized protein LOC129925651 isoform X9 [Biomphalaria glabrata]|uniref:Uncharacterized protein LOC129925651 isoform X9 n=1 Tax=Biomphalaria glabrata TaxID=6526 RepID=A0A9W3A2J0_BIOGL|nr:uncharacterized protein LOC129925651 isoform X9 [Biomphalaria glabrata]